MVGMVKKIDGDGFGNYCLRRRLKIPFIRADISNRLEPGERMGFSPRMVKDTAFAQNITAMPDRRLPL
jgi:hypothetical protein